MGTYKLVSSYIISRRTSRNHIGNHKIQPPTTIKSLADSTTTSTFATTIKTTRLNSFKMHFSDLSPHVHFLNDAAHLLSHSSPETSAFLMRRRNELLVENDIPISDAQRQHVCSACGHIMIPGGHQQDTLEIKTDKAKKNAQRSNNKKKTSKLTSSRTAAQQQTSTPSAPPQPPPARAMPGGISKVMTCGSCSRITIRQLQGPKRISRVKKANLESSKVLEGRKLQQGQAEPAKPSSSTSTSASSSANANSKKRAKNRKAGLQALLDQKQSSSSSGFGLSLSDFMKK